MNELCHEIFDTYQIRKSRMQKEAFRQCIHDAFTALGYSVKIERESGMCSNVVVGDLEHAKVIFSAHYDTCAWMPIPNFITPRNFFFYFLYQIFILVVMIAIAAVPAVLVALLTGNILYASYAFSLTALLVCVFLLFGPANRHTANDNTSGVLALTQAICTLDPALRDQVAFVFFDLEEAGLIGSAHFRRRHARILPTTPLINFDCVSDGDHMFFIAKRALRQQADLYAAIQASVPPTPGKEVLHLPAATTLYPSDQAGFPLSIAVASMHKKPVIGYYMDRIHTARDTVMQEENIEMMAGFMKKLAEKV